MQYQKILITEKFTLPTILGSPALGTPTARRQSQNQTHIQRHPVHAGLPAADDFLEHWNASTLPHQQDGPVRTRNAERRRGRQPSSPSI